MPSFAFVCQIQHFVTSDVFLRRRSVQVCVYVHHSNKVFVLVGSNLVIASLCSIELELIFILRITNRNQEQ